MVYLANFSGMTADPHIDHLHMPMVSGEDHRQRGVNICQMPDLMPDKKAGHLSGLLVPPGVRLPASGGLTCLKRMAFSGLPGQREHIVFHQLLDPLG